MPTAEDEDNKNKEEEEKKDATQQEDGGDGEGKKDDDEEKKDEDLEQSSKKLLAQLEERVAQLSQENASLKQQLETANSTVAKLTKGLQMKGNGAPLSASAPQNFNDLVKGIDPNLPQQEWRKQYLQLVENHPQLFEQTYGIPAKRSMPTK